MKEYRKLLHYYFGRKTKAPDPDAPYICPYPFFVEGERLLQEERERLAAESTDEKQQPTDEQ